MIVAGIDVGGKNVHVVILKDGKIIAKSFAPTGINKAKAAESAYDDVLRNAGLTREDIQRIVATGSAARRATFADSVIPDAAADARGAIELIPSTRTLVDVGAEEGRAIKLNSEGKVLDFAVNEKCAAGTGTFVDAMARALEVDVEEMAHMSLKSTTSIPMNAQCAVFGESEVVSLIHAKTPKQDIARAVHDAIAGRIGSVVRIIGIEKDVVIIGGVANNVGLVDSLKRDLGMEIIVPDEPEYVSALGAALIASQNKLDLEASVKGAGKEPVQEIKERRLSS